MPTGEAMASTLIWKREKGGPCSLRQRPFPQISSKALPQGEGLLVQGQMPEPRSKARTSDGITGQTQRQDES